VGHIHELNIVHGNLKIVCPPFQLRVGHALTFAQTNILVDARGHARIAGLGAALLPSPTPGVEVDRFFHGAAPELVDPRRFRLTDAGTTKHSDMYAFGALTWEVGPILRAISYQIIDVRSYRRSLLDESHSPNRVGSQGSTRC
jgi:serine/threonine protein kinase